MLFGTDCVDSRFFRMLWKDESRLGMIHTWHPWKLSNCQDPPHPLSIYVQNSSTPLTSDVQFQANPPLSPNDNQSIKRKHNPRMNIICYQALPSGRFLFSVSNINLVWLSFDISPFSCSLTFCYFVALYSCVYSCQLCSIIHIFSILLCLIVGGGGVGWVAGGGGVELNAPGGNISRFLKMGSYF